MPLSVEIGAKVDPEMAEQLSTIARAQGRTRADIIRRACDEYISSLHRGPSRAEIIQQRPRATAWLDTIKVIAGKLGRPFAVLPDMTEFQVIDKIATYIVEYRAEIIGFEIDVARAERLADWERRDEYQMIRGDIMSDVIASFTTWVDYWGDDDAQAMADGAV